MSKPVEGFATGRLQSEARSFVMASAGPQAGQFDPTPRYPDGTPVVKGFSTGTKRGRPGDKIGVGHAPETKAEMVRRYQAGEGLNPLAAAYSTTAMRVREILVQAGVSIRGFGRPEVQEAIVDLNRSKDMAKATDKAKVAEMVRLREEGKGDVEIALAVGVAPSTVYNNRKKAQAGMKTAPSKRKAGRRPAVPTVADEMVRDVYARYVEGESLDALYADGAMTCVPETMVKQFKRLGLAFPRARWVAASPDPAPQMDDPEALAADARVIQVHELRPYVRPQAFDLGSLIQPGNVVTIARAIKGMVDEMNTLPGVRADFGFVYELTVGR